MGLVSAVRPAAVVAGAVTALAILSGCGSPPTGRIPSNNLAIFTSLPLSGERGPEGRAVLRGEKIALQDSGAMVGPFTVYLDAMDDTDPTTGQWSPDQAAENARQASRNRATIAYIGDLDSGATAVSLPVNNEMGILQVSPLSEATGLTQSGDKGEPQKYYPSGVRTFARLAPTGAAEATALAGWIAALGHHTVVIADDGHEDGQSGVIDLEKALGKAHLKLVKAYRVDSRPKHDVTGDVANLVALHAGALIYAGGDSTAAARLLNAVHAADADLPLFVTSSSTHGDLAGKLDTATAASVAGVSPLVGLPQDPKAKAFADRYRTAFETAPPPAAYYGYEAMRTVLNAIRTAGKPARNRISVIRAYKNTVHAGTVLGGYRIDGAGDIIGGPLGGFDIVNGQLKLVRRFGGTAG